MRNILVGKLIALLQESGFIVESFLHSNMCFDIIARKGKQTIILKVFENIDALRAEQALELKKLVVLFDAAVLLVGEKTKAFALEDNVIYNRYGISAVTYNTLRNFLKGNIPSISCFKGKEIVELNAEKLREKRNEMGISFNDLARELDTTTESLYRYEQGAKASLGMAKKLEAFFKTDLISEIDFLEKPQQIDEMFLEERPEDEALGKIHAMGAKLALFKRAPFRAFSNPSERLLISEAKSKQEAKRKALKLEKAKVVFKTHSVIISKEPAKKTLGKSAVVGEEELDSFTKFSELFDLIKEREKRR